MNRQFRKRHYHSCNYYHTRVALRKGFVSQMVENLPAGDIDNPDPADDQVRVSIREFA